MTQHDLDELIKDGTAVRPGILTDWEIKFLIDMDGRHVDSLSDKQVEVLDRIERKVYGT